MLRLWDALIGSAVMFAIAVIAFGTMLQIIAISEAIRRIGVVMGCALLLSILPPIIVGIWSGIPLWQRIAVLSLVAITVAMLASRKRGTHRTGTGRH